MIMMMITNANKKLYICTYYSKYQSWDIIANLYSYKLIAAFRIMPFYIVILRLSYLS